MRINIDVGLDQSRIGKTQRAQHYFLTNLIDVLK